MPTREYSRMKKILRVKNDKQLRSIAKKLHKAQRGMKRKMDILFEAGWRIKNIQRNIKYLEQETLIERGIRKGKGCKAIDQGNYTIYRCNARNGFTWARGLDSFYGKYCSTCRLSRKEIKTRVTLKKVFE